VPVELMPGDPHHAPAGGLKDPIALSILLGPTRR
jgi:hypothetical protein